MMYLVQVHEKNIDPVTFFYITCRYIHFLVTIYACHNIQNQVYICTHKIYRYTITSYLDMLNIGRSLNKYDIVPQCEIAFSCAEFNRRYYGAQFLQSFNHICNLT